MTNNNSKTKQHRFTGLRLTAYWIVTIFSLFMCIAQGGWWIIPLVFAYLIRPETTLEASKRARSPASSIFLTLMVCILIGIICLSHSGLTSSYFYIYLSIFFGYYLLLDLIWFGYIPSQRSHLNEANKNA